MEPPNFSGPRPFRKIENATGLTLNPLTSNTLPPNVHIMMEEDRSRRAASVLSMDDLEAAQALEGLRSGMCFRVSYAEPTQNIAQTCGSSWIWLAVRRTLN
jgi:hypothetical protein